MAIKANCAVIVIAHSRKPEKGDSSAHVGNLDSLRGASSQGGVIRCAETLFTPSEKDEKEWRFEGARTDHARMDNAKNNLGRRRPTPLWFQRIGAKIANGEIISVLDPLSVERKVKKKGEFTVSDLRLEAIAAALGECQQVGEWHPWSAVVAKMPDEHAERFADESNLAKTINTAFGGKDVNAVALDGVGQISRKAAPSKRGGKLYRLIRKSTTDDKGDVDE